MVAWLGAGKEKNSRIYRGKIFLLAEFFERASWQIKNVGKL